MWKRNSFTQEKQSANFMAVKLKHHDDRDRIHLETVLAAAVTVINRVTVIGVTLGAAAVMIETLVTVTT